MSSRRSTTDQTAGPGPSSSSQERERSGARLLRIEPVPGGSNIVILRGRLSRIPEHRVLASGSVLLSADLTVRPAEGSTETVPIVWFDPPARALRFDESDDVVVVGRVRRRFFRSGGATLSRTEVGVSTIESARAPARIRAAVLSAAVGMTLSE
jgi:single-strand DNA-binding protein